MYYPADMTADDIMEFEHELNMIRDIEEGHGLWLVNWECQAVAEQQKALELETTVF